MDDDELRRWARAQRPRATLGDFLVTVALGLVFVISALVALVIVLGGLVLIWELATALWDLLGRPEDPLPCHPDHC